MAEGPILFSGEEVRAILDGRKAMTRRVLNRQPPADTQFVTQGNAGWAAFDSFGHGFAVDLPYALGDTLWVCEAYCGHLGDLPSGIAAPARTVADNGGTHLWYQADGASLPFKHSRWSPPSICMPRWASRLTLLVTAVRVERLREMPVDDAYLEGMPGPSVAAFHAFQDLWQSINGKHPGCSWEASPWVAVVSFERVP